MEAARSSETLVPYNHTTQRSNPENHELYLHSRENRKPRNSVRTVDMLGMLSKSKKQDMMTEFWCTVINSISWNPKKDNIKCGPRKMCGWDEKLTEKVDWA
jgi:hypothetical protein